MDEERARKLAKLAQVESVLSMERLTSPLIIPLAAMPLRFTATSTVTAGLIMVPAWFTGELGITRFFANSQVGLSVH